MLHARRGRLHLSLIDPFRICHFRESKLSLRVLFLDLVIEVEHCSQDDRKNNTDQINQANCQFVKCMRANQAI